MGKYEYKVVPFKGVVSRKQTAADVSEQLRIVITQQAENGWELDQVAAVDIEVSPGCLAGLFGASTTYAKYDQVIFRKLK